MYLSILVVCNIFIGAFASTHVLSQIPSDILQVLFGTANLQDLS